MAVPVVTWEQYAADWSGLHGGVDLGRVRPGVRRWLWLGFVVARSLQRIRVPAGAVTALGLLSSVTVAVVVTHGSGGMLLAALLVVVATLADTVDGALAVLSGHTTRLGYVYDAVVDRIGEACWLIALWRIGAAGHVVVAAGALAWLHEYVRSRGNAAGMTEIAAVTVGERPTRIMLTIGGLVMAGLAETFNPHIAAGIAAFTAAAWIVLGLIGITQLLAAVHRALAGRRWPTWRPPGTPKATTPSVPPAASAPPAPPTAAAARPASSGPMGAADRSDGGFGERYGDRSYQRGTGVADARDEPGGTAVGPISDGRDQGVRGQEVRDSGISEVVSYAASSADEPSEPSPDLALREPTLDDLLGDAGERVRSAVGKYGRSVTVYRSQAAGTAEVDATNPIEETGATNATDTAPESLSAVATGVAADTDVGPAGDGGTGDDGSDGSGIGDSGTGGHASGSGAAGDGATHGGAAGGHGGVGGDHATPREQEDRMSAENGDGPGTSGGARTGVHSRARIRFGRRSHGGAAKPVADEAGRGPEQATSPGSGSGPDG